MSHAYQNQYIEEKLKLNTEERANDRQEKKNESLYDSILFILPNDREPHFKKALLESSLSTMCYYTQTSSFPTLGVKYHHDREKHDSNTN